MNELQPLAVKPKQGGYTIVELSIALTIIAILIVSGIVGITSVLRSNKANTQLEDSGRTDGHHSQLLPVKFRARDIRADMAQACDRA